MSAFGGKVDIRIWLPNNHSIQMVTQSATCEQLGGLSKEDCAVLVPGGGKCGQFGT